ncbi:MAG TPA: hemolysin family protein [Vicinamibacterales bacterium]|nr:hemolysin family protein [Vicinamibacterales bacterium]
MTTGLNAFLILVSALGLLFFALVEMAFTRLMRLPERLEAERESEDGVLPAYLDDPTRFFVPARVIRGSLLILAMALLAQHVEPGVWSWAALFGTGLTLAIGVGQFVPAIVIRAVGAERILALLLPLFTLVANVISPLTALIVSFLGAVEGGSGRDSNGSAPVAASVEAGRAAAEAAEESRLLRSVVDFGDTLVREVMTPRPDIVAIRSASTIDDLRQLVREQEYSRLPVYAENLDNIVGLVVVKDLIQRAEELPGGGSVTEIMRPATFVPETKRVMDLLREFQQKRVQIAVVVDEYGGTAGLVTVEDVVEELVGEIRDEYDSEAEPIVQEDEDTFVFSAKVATSDMVERLRIDIEDGAFETVGGYVLARVGRVPGAGETFAFDGLDVEILEAERRRIHKVRIHRAPSPAGVPGE